MSHTTRTHTAAYGGPVLFEVTTVAAHVTVVVEDRPAAMVTVSTDADNGPASTSVRRVSFEDDPGIVSVLLTEPSGGMESTVIHRGSRVTVVQNGGAVIGTMVGAVFDSFHVVDGGMVIGGNPVRGVAPIRIEARLPLGSSLACETTSGDVGTRGELADVDAVTVSGNIRIDSARHPHLRSTSGDVRVAALTGIRASATTVSGHIRVHAATSSATVRATSVSGDIRVTGPDVDLDARTVSGRVTTR